MLESQRSRNPTASFRPSAAARLRMRSQASCAGSAAAARLAMHARIMTRREMSRPVAGIDPNIVFRQIARPEARRALAFSADGKPDFAIARIQFGLQFGLGEGRGEAAATDQNALHMDIGP